MTHTQVPGMAAPPSPFLTAHETERAVELIESAERSAPYCLCGRHMIAVANGDQVWLECSSQSEEKTGLGGFFSRLTAFGHTRRMIMELPSTN
ncbi:MAG: hypothetical protein U9O18_02660 [Chloroflexota bacterium]|nr:hypothetical protein [Chloroflexota bacterium]